MLSGSFNYYGYDKDTYNDCSALIRTTNFRHVHILNIWFLFINLFFTVCSHFNFFGLNRLKLGTYGIFLAVAAVFEIVLLILRKNMEKPFTVVLVYLSSLFLLSYGISISMGSPYLAATMYLVLVVLIALAYIDNMIRITVILVVFSIAFLYSSFSLKPESIAYQDLYNMIIFLFLALVLHYTFQRARMSQYVTYQNNIQIQRELEVQSSFDALSSLLNRRRFFSLAKEIVKRRPEGRYTALCIIDLDSFKQINDRLGHQMGDKAIQLTGNTIIDSLGIDLSEKWSFSERAVQTGSSLAGRIGGDEFVVLINGMKNREEVLSFLQSMLSKLNSVRFDRLEGIYASLGATEIPYEDTDIDNAYSRADAALYESKRSGKNKINFPEYMKEDAADDK